MNCFAEVFKKVVVPRGVSFIDGIHPDQVQKTARRELPGIDEINVELIKILVRRAGPIRGTERAVVVEVQVFVVIEFRPIVPPPD